jgi:hypothetical protein
MKLERWSRVRVIPRRGVELDPRDYEGEWLADAILHVEGVAHVTLFRQDSDDTLAVPRSCVELVKRPW